MTIKSKTLHDDQFVSVIEDTDTNTGHVVGTRTVWKAGTHEFNREQLHKRAKDAVGDLDQAEALLAGGGARWDALTPAQRTAINLGLVRQNRALIRIVLNLMDSPS